MKKLLLIAALVFGIAAFVYYHFSTPRVLDRRLDSLLDTMTFGAVSLKENSTAADDFIAHFTEDVLFTGSGNDLIVGSPTRDDLKMLYIQQLRTYARSCKATATGNTQIALKRADLAQMETNVTLTGNLHGNTSFERTFPVTFMWQKREGKWAISAVRLKEPVDIDVY